MQKLPIGKRNDASVTAKGEPLPAGRRFSGTAHSAHFCKFNEKTRELEPGRRQLDAVQGKVQAQWGELTDDDLDVIEGNRRQLAGKLQERYGKAQEEADREINDWPSRH